MQGVLMHKLLCILGLLSTIILFACSRSVPQEINPLDDSLQAFQDTLQKWEEYMESSADGLWEDSAQYVLDIERIHVFGGEENPNPPFYDPLFVHVIGDTLLISDEATQSLVCMDTTGTVLWKFGERGEGPGYFAGIGQVDVCGDTIAVINNGLSFIELLNRDGTLIGRLSIERPQDVAFIDSRRLLVFSKKQSGGDVHLLDIEADSILFSFGDAEWEEWPNNGSRYEIWGLYIEPDRVAYLSHFEKKLVFANITDNTSYWTDIRKLPFDITPSSFAYDAETNTQGGVSFPLYRSMFIGPFGELNIVFRNLMYNGEMINRDNLSDYTPVTVFDRFSVNGEYLDSYCLPDSVINSAYYNYNGYMAAIQSTTGTIFGYRIGLRD